VFPQREVKEWMSGLVCVKINAGGDDGHPLAKKFGVDAFPTLVLLEPSGKVLYNQAGAPADATHFVEFFGLDANNAAVKAVMDHDAKAAAAPLFYLRRWFAGTSLSKQADEIYGEFEKEPGFAEAYEAAQKEYEKRLEEARDAVKKEQERRDKAKALKEEADGLYKKYLRTKAYEIYRKILAEYPDLPEADEAEAILKKNKQKLR
jgi:tetratricopeptide (TPR) repeat protein